MAAMMGLVWKECKLECARQMENGLKKHQFVKVSYLYTQSTIEYKDVVWYFQVIQCVRISPTQAMVGLNSVVIHPDPLQATAVTLDTG